MNKIIMGIDGGGTKSQLGIFDQEGKCLAIKMHGTLNHEMLPGSYKQLEDELRLFVHSAIKDAGLNVKDIAYTVIGLAGVDTREQHQIITEIFKRVGLVDFTLVNDGYLGIWAGCPGGAGICAINGTGSVLTAIDARGTSMQVGGIGEITDDRGGSGWYGTQLLSKVYAQLFKSAHKTMLTEMIFSRLNISHRDDYTEAVAIGLQNETLRVSDLNRLIFTAASKQDKVALDILADSAEHYARCIEFLATNMYFPKENPLYVTLAGSVFVKEPVRILPDLIESRVNALLGQRPVRFVILEAPPVVGAVMWGYCEAGIIGDARLVQAAFE